MDRIWSINVDRRASTLLELLDLTQADKRNKPIIILLQDPPNLTREFIIKTYLNEYNIISREGLAGNEEATQQNNVTLYEKNLIEPIGNHHYSELALGCEFIFNSKCFIVFSFYLRPSSSYDKRETLRIIKEASASIGKSRLIIGGDTNATDALWAPISEIEPKLTSQAEESGRCTANIQRKNTRGKVISKFIDEMKLTCLNNISLGPTFVSNIRIDQRGSANLCSPNRYPSSHIDIVAVGQKALRQWNLFNLVNIVGSQHKLLIIKSNRNLRSHRNIKKNIYTG